MLAEETSPPRSETKDCYSWYSRDNDFNVHVSLILHTNGYNPEVGQGGHYTCSEFVLELKNYEPSNPNLFFFEDLFISERVEAGEGQRSGQSIQGGLCADRLTAASPTWGLNSSTVKS